MRGVVRTRSRLDSVRRKIVQNCAGCVAEQSMLENCAIAARRSNAVAMHKRSSRAIFQTPHGEIEDALLQSSIPIEEIIGSGGGETKGTQRLRKTRFSSGWRKHNFVVQRVVDGTPLKSRSHRSITSGSSLRGRSPSKSNGTTRIRSSTATWRISSDSTHRSARTWGNSHTWARPPSRHAKSRETICRRSEYQ